MKELRIAALVSAILILLITLLGLKNVNAEENDEGFVNGDFETCDLTGWEASGDAFEEAVVTDRDFFWANRPFNNEGECHLYGYLAGEDATGELKSNTFTLEGTGYISFLMGAGADTNQTYVSLVDAKTGFQYAKVSNSYFDDDDFTSNYGRVMIDARDYLGKEVYIRIVDEDDDSDGFSFINVDDFDIDYDPDDFETTPAPDFTLSLDRANDFLEDNAGNVDPKYRMSYHLMPPHGWMNDPNGFSYFQDEIHLFYQHNPYNEYWGGMHWGHATTEDFIKWDHQPVAVAPDAEYDDGGIYSGSAVEIDGKLYTMYTAIDPQKEGEPALQQQAIAVSEDGINFEKVDENPVITKDMYPEDVMSNVDVRDPKVFEHEGMYYAVIGNNHHGDGQAVLFESEDFYDWSFKSVLLSADEIDPDNPSRFGVNWECPDVFTVDGKDILIASPQLMPSEGDKYTNLHSALYFAGNMDYDSGKFDVEHYDEIDAGHDFYAPQSMEMPDGRRVITAWMQDWGTVDEIFTAELEHGWAGAMTVPRELDYIDGELYTYPIRELEGYRVNRTSYTYETFEGFKSFEGVKGDTKDIELTVDLKHASNFGIRLFETDDDFTLLRYDVSDETLIIDRSHSSDNVYETTRRQVHAPMQDDGTLDLRLLLDNSSIEVFANDGQRSIASLVYTEEGAEGITFFSEGRSTIERLDAWDIVVD